MPASIVNKSSLVGSDALNLLQLGILALRLLTDIHTHAYTISYECNTFEYGFEIPVDSRYDVNS